jgi:hypothetical protein
MKATRIDMPVAAEVKLCTASPAIWVRSLIVDSPEYACQLVLVVKLAAVLSDESVETAPSFCGLNGNHCCVRCCR